MFENIDKYETEHPDTNWNGYLSYCRICGDIIVRINDDTDIECSCQSAISTANHTAGAAIERIYVTKTTKYYANLDDKQIPVSNLREFGVQFKDVFIKNAPSKILLSAMVPKFQNSTTQIKSPKLTKSSKSQKSDISQEKSSENQNSNKKSE